MMGPEYWHRPSEKTPVFASFDHAGTGHRFVYYRRDPVTIASEVESWLWASVAIPGSGPATGGGLEPSIVPAPCSSAAAFCFCTLSLAFFICIRRRSALRVSCAFSRCMVPDIDGIDAVEVMGGTASS